LHNGHQIQEFLDRKFEAQIPDVTKSLVLKKTHQYFIHRPERRYEGDSTPLATVNKVAGRSGSIASQSGDGHRWGATPAKAVAGCVKRKGKKKWV